MIVISAGLVDPAVLEVGSVGAAETASAPSAETIQNLESIVISCVSLENENWNKREEKLNLRCCTSRGKEI